LGDVEDIAAKYPGSIIGLVGDLNHLNTDRFENEAGLMQLVKDITHEKSILDKFLTNRPELFAVSVCASSIKTKHKSIIANSDHKIFANPVRKTVFFPDIREPNLNLLRHALAAHNWGAIYAAEPDVNACFDAFNETVTKMIEHHIPKKQITMRSSEPWFITPLIKSLLRKRNQLKRKGRIIQADTISLKLNKLIAEVRTSCFSDIDPSNSRKLWKTVDKATNYRGQIKTSSSVPSQSDSYAEQLNEYFAKIATDDDYDSNLINQTIVRNASNCSNNRICEIYEFEIFRSFNTLKKTAPGADNIPHWFYRNCAAEISRVVTFLINLSIRTGTVPCSWKRALVTPVPKKTTGVSVGDPSNMRPISVTPILSRIVEKFIVRKFLWPQLDDNLMGDQFGFRPTGSTTAALIHMMHFVFTSFNSGSDYVRCLLIDYSRAFDMVNHQILLEELGTLDLHVNIYRWIADFLTGRTQAVKINNVISKYLPISRSVVQGSGLGPMLYLVLARKLKPVSKKNNIFKYADDTTLMTPQKTNVCMDDEFKHIIKWSSENKLLINTNKTREIIFWKTKQCSNNYIIPTMDNIERVSVVTLLGVVLDSFLSWNFHVDHILVQSTQRFYLLNQLKHMSLNIVSLSNVFNALVVSRIRYALPVYSGCLTQSDIGRINAMFRKAKRWGITNQDIDVGLLSVLADSGLSNKAKNNTNHCLHPLIPKLRDKKYNLRINPFMHEVSKINYDKLQTSFVHRCFT
jgi:hypothetical protein